ncbi:MAG TPA: hypothetical protein VK204_11980 [Nocardioidaceae bacterium]|jgi:hypothetical protein|nr:hypothetical protein [Nocardioidaceae bacterium]
MTNTPTTRGAPQRQYSGGAVGVIAFAGILMVLSGAFHVVQGLVALVNDNFYVIGQDYVFKFDVTTWGWIHLIAGIIVALAGMALFQGSVWARTVAVILACVSIIASFLWMPYYPLWSLVVIVFDLFVIWAVTVHGRDVREA